MHTQRKRGTQWQLGLVAIRLLLYAALYWGYNGISNDRYETTFFQFWLLMIAVELSTFLVSQLPSRFWKTKRADGETTRQRMISERPYNLLAMGVLAIHAVTVAYPVHKLILNFWIGYSILPVLSFLVLLFLLLKYLLSRQSTSRTGKLQRNAWTSGDAKCGYYTDNVSLQSEQNKSEVNFFASIQEAIAMR